jgi:hypothetical protein
MPDPFFGIFIFFAVMVLTAVLFFGWVIASIFRITFRGIFGYPPRNRWRRTDPTMTRCSTAGCWTANPVQARFCRRCGKPLTVQQVRYRRAAIF